MKARVEAGEGKQEEESGWNLHSAQSPRHQRPRRFELKQSECVLRQVNCVPAGSPFPDRCLLLLRSQMKLLIICAKIKNERTWSQEN